MYDVTVVGGGSLGSITSASINILDKSIVTKNMKKL